MARLLSVSFALLAAGAAAKWQAFNFTQTADHFSAKCMKTFQQRYYVDDTHWRPGGPLLHFLGGESPIGTEQLPGMYPWAAGAAAKSLQAMVLVTEHRYFGESLPFGPDLSFSVGAEGCSGGMGLLNVEQALRDFVAVAASVKASKCPGCAVVALGGSYPGLLAAMIRVRYPDAVHSAVAASAPLGFLAGGADPFGWFRIVTDAAAALDRQCPDAVRRMFSAIRRADASALTSQSGGALCMEGLGDDELRREAEALARTELATLGMSNYPPQSSPLAAACGRIADALASPHEGGLGAMRALLLKNQTSDPSPPCISVLAQRPAGRATSVDCIDRTGCGGGRAGEAWDYMGCTWLRIGIATNNVTDMFPPMSWSEDWVAEYCARRFEAAPRPDLLPARFSFADPAQLRAVTSRIIFTNGLRDGWSAGGILESPSAELPAIVMPNGAHHSEMALPTAGDTEDVVEARRAILGHLNGWLQLQSATSLGQQPTLFYGVLRAKMDMAAAAPGVIRSIWIRPALSGVLLAALAVASLLFSARRAGSLSAPLSTRARNAGCNQEPLLA